MVTLIYDHWRGVGEGGRPAAGKAPIQQEQVVVRDQELRAPGGLLRLKREALQLERARRAQAVPVVGGDLAPPGRHERELVLITGPGGSDPAAERLEVGRWDE